MAWLDTKIPPPALFAATATGIWYAARQLPQFSLAETLPRVLPDPAVVGQVVKYAPVAAGVVAGVAVGIQAASMIGFRANKTTISPIHPAKATTLVTDGIYGSTRNPMYLSLAALLTAWSIYTGVGPLISIPVIGGFVAYLTQFQIKPEEAALSKLFGDEYAAYVKKVPRWI